jgi:hypothetical protein
MSAGQPARFRQRPDLPGIPSRITRLTPPPTPSLEKAGSYIERPLVSFSKEGEYILQGWNYGMYYNFLLFAIAERGTKGVSPHANTS